MYFFTKISFYNQFWRTILVRPRSTLIPSWTREVDITKVVISTLPGNRGVTVNLNFGKVLSIFQALFNRKIVKFFVCDWWPIFHWYFTLKEMKRRVGCFAPWLTYRSGCYNKKGWVSCLDILKIVSCDRIIFEIIGLVNIIDTVGYLNYGIIRWNNHCFFHIR